MSKIYVPSEYLNKPCYVINNDYIRVYNTVNTTGNNVIYDIYINNDYMIKQGTASYSANTQCDRLNTYTDDVFYRVDIADILIITFLFIIMCSLSVWMLVRAFIRRLR